MPQIKPTHTWIDHGGKKPNVNPKHAKDRTLTFFNGETATFAVVDAQGNFLTKDGTYGDSGDAKLFESDGAHKVAKGNNVVDVSKHPLIAVLFYSNR